MLDTYKPIIGVIARPEKDSEGYPITSLEDTVRIALLKKGSIPLMITPPQKLVYDSLDPRKVELLTKEELKDIKRLINICDGLLLPGGYRWYQFDEEIYKYALEKNMPVMGICCGMQMMCKVSSMKDDIATDNTVKNETTINHKQKDVNYVHKVYITENSKLYSILKTNEIMVNSRHGYHAPSEGDLLISASSEDGLIEAVEMKDKNFVVGVQWHPETMIDYDEGANKILDTFINECNNYSRVKKM